MPFYAYAKQRDGCDYTIACGQKLVELKATTFEAAALEAEELFVSSLDDGLVSISIFDVREWRSIDMESLRAKRDAQNRARDQLVIDARERIEYERLKKKFGE